MREYLHIDQLAKVTPWSPSAIRTMMARGTFKLGVHYFKPHGPNSRPIFKWAVVVSYIESNVVNLTDVNSIELADGSVIKLDEAAKHISRLRD